MVSTYAVNYCRMMLNGCWPTKLESLSYFSPISKNALARWSLPKPRRRLARNGCWTKRLESLPDCFSSPTVKNASARWSLRTSRKRSTQNSCGPMKARKRVPSFHSPLNTNAASSFKTLRKLLDHWPSLPYCYNSYSTSN